MHYLKSAFFLLATVLFFGSCSPKVSTSLVKSYSPLDYREEIRVYTLHDAAPGNAEVIGVVKIGDSGFSTNCGLDVAIEKAKEEARKAGGNAIKITRHKVPSFWGSSCHRITADILKAGPTAFVETEDSAGELPADADYALLHVYRYSGAGPLISYDLHLGDDVICRVKNNWRETVKITKDGLNTLWARTESKSETPVKIEFGKVYYLRCSVTMGAFVGRPKLELVDKNTGKTEFEMIRNFPNPSFPGATKHYTAAYPRWRIAVNGGWSYRIGKLPEGLDAGIRQYFKELKSGASYSGELAYYFSEQLGAGFRYGSYLSKNQTDNVYITYPDGQTRYGRMSDDITITWVGPYFSTRLLGSNKKNALLLDLGIGYLGYRNNASLLSESIKTKGGTAGIYWGLGYDFSLSKNLALGLQLAYTAGTLTRFNLTDHTGTTTVKLDKDNYESLSRLDLSVGIRFIR